MRALVLNNFPPKKRLVLSSFPLIRMLRLILSKFPLKTWRTSAVADDQAKGRDELE
jgi:hypothetical protein